MRILFARLNDAPHIETRPTTDHRINPESVDLTSSCDLFKVCLGKTIVCSNENRSSDRRQIHVVQPVKPDSGSLVAVPAVKAVTILPFGNKTGMTEVVFPDSDKFLKLFQQGIGCTEQRFKVLLSTNLSWTESCGIRLFSNALNSSVIKASSMDRFPTP